MISVLPSTVAGTDLSAQEFRDALCMRYGRTPKDLPTHCDGCGSKFTMQHALQCKKGGLVIYRHDEVKNELAHLIMTAMSDSAIRDEPLIISGRSAKSPKAENTKEANDQSLNEQRGDISARGFWSIGTECIVDVRVTDTDQASSIKRGRTPEREIEIQESEKKRKYLQACLDQRRHFTPYVLIVSVEGLIGREAEAFTKRLAAKLALRWKKPYSQVCGFVKAKMSIAIVRATHLCLRGSRIPIQNVSRERHQWDDGAGLNLFR